MSNTTFLVLVLVILGGTVVVVLLLCPGSGGKADLAASTAAFYAVLRSRCSITYPMGACSPAASTAFVQVLKEGAILTLNPNAEDPPSPSSPIEPCPTITGEVYNLDDYTFYIQGATPTQLRQDRECILANSPVISAHQSDERRAVQARVHLGESYSDQLHISDEINGLEVEGRALACSCYLGRQVSVTVRIEHRRGGDLTTGETNGRPYHSDAKARIHDVGIADTPNLRHPLSFQVIYELLAELLFHGRPFSQAKGLIVVSGATSSGKSNIARGLVRKYLDELNHAPIKGRRPHLLTIEDPIESLFAQYPAEAQEYGFDYTPRQIGIDVPSLDMGLRDALRQTPAVVYVGETRKQRDWRELVEFAGTGHLVVTTAHAGSLVESIERILDAVDASSPAGRGEVAQRILAIVHLVGERCTYPVEGPAPEHKSIQPEVTLPTLWRQTPAGITGLVADGLASILPNDPGDETVLPDRSFSAIGRHWFARALTHRVKPLLLSPENKDALFQKAIALDLEGR